MQKRLVSLFLALASVGIWAPPAAEAEIVERIVAVVNDRIVLLSELNLKLREYLPRLARVRDPEVRKRQIKLLQRRELENLVSQILIEEEGRRRKLGVSTLEIEKAIRTVLRQNQISRADLINTLKQEGYPFARYREDLKQQILRLKTLNLAVRSRVSVSDDEVRAYYRKKVAKMGVGLKLKLRQIFLRIDRSQGAEGMQGARARAVRILAAIKAGTPFGKLAAQQSDDADTRGKGGALGWVERGKLPPLVDGAVFRAKGTKKTIGPVVTDSGLYLVYIEERKESEAVPFEDAKGKLRNELFRLRAQKRTAAWVKTLRSKSLIDIRL